MAQQLARNAIADKIWRGKRENKKEKEFFITKLGFVWELSCGFFLGFLKIDNYHLSALIKIIAFLKLQKKYNK